MNRNQNEIFEFRRSQFDPKVDVFLDLKPEIDVLLDFDPAIDVFLDLRYFFIFVDVLLDFDRTQCFIGPWPS